MKAQEDNHLHYCNGSIELLGRGERVSTEDPAVGRDVKRAKLR